MKNNEEKRKIIKETDVEPVVFSGYVKRLADDMIAEVQEEGILEEDEKEFLEEIQEELKEMREHIAGDIREISEGAEKDQAVSGGMAGGGFEIKGGEKVSLASLLVIIAGDLLAISQNFTDRDEKEGLYARISEVLKSVGEQILQDMKILEEERPEKVAEILKDIDEALLAGQNKFLDAIELMLEFIQNEDPALIEAAKTALREAEASIRKGDDLNIYLEDLIEEQGFDI